MMNGEFTRKVLRAVRRIPPGRVATYGDVAALAGSPRAARAVGNILRACRDPGTPCHRVIAAGGALGGYGGNLHLKRQLLRHEGIEVGESRIRGFTQVRFRAALLLVAALATGCGSVGTSAEPAPQATGAAADARLEADALMAVVHELASPRYEGRLTGTAGGRAARAYVRHAFANIGLEPAGTAGFDQPFAFEGYPDAANLIGRVRGTDATARTIVLSAHYDHRGIREGQIHPGADDNASGIAVLLAVARHLRRAPLRHSVVFAAFDAEELGLQGARAFVAAPPVPLAAVAINVNLDMLSRNDRNEIYAAGASHTPWLRPLLEAVQRRVDVNVRLGHDRPEDGEDDWTLQSDHGVFHEAGVPFLYFGVEDHADYHRPSDTADKINPVFLQRVGNTVLETLFALDRDVDRASRQ